MEKFIGGEFFKKGGDIDPQREKNFKVDTHVTLPINTEKQEIRVAFDIDRPLETPEKQKINIEKRDEITERGHYHIADHTTRNYDWLAEQSAVMKGESPLNLRHFWLQDEIYSLSGPQVGFSPYKEKLRIVELKADLRLRAYIEELEKLREEGATEQQVLQHLSDQIFEGIAYERQQNSALHALAGKEKTGERTVNCEGRAKLAAILLQEIGYDQEDIFFESFSDHVRTIVKTAKGLKVIEGKLHEYQKEAGTVLTPVEDVIRGTLHVNEDSSTTDFSLGEKAFHTRMREKIDHMLFSYFPALIKKFEERQVRPVDLPAAQKRYNDRTVLAKMISDRLDTLIAPVKQGLSDTRSAIQSNEVTRIAFQKAKSGVKATAFLSGAFFAGREAYNQSDTIKNSVDSVQNSIHEQISELSAAVTDATEAVKELIVETSVETDGKDNDKTGTKRKDTSETDFQVEFTKELPRHLEKYYRTTFDSTDYVIGKIDYQEKGNNRVVVSEKELYDDTSTTPFGIANLKINNLETIIHPDKSERRFTQGFWEAYLREVHRPKTVEKGGNDEKTATGNYLDSKTIHTLKIESPDKQHPLSVNDVIGPQGSNLESVLTDPDWRQALDPDWLYTMYEPSEVMYESSEKPIIIELDHKEVATITFDLQRRDFEINTDHPQTTKDWIESQKQLLHQHLEGWINRSLMAGSDKAQRVSASGYTATAADHALQMIESVADSTGGLTENRHRIVESVVDAYNRDIKN